MQIDKNEENEEMEDMEETTLERPSKRKNPNYVLTEARKQAFDKAREKRLANIEAKKKEKEELEKVKQEEVKEKIVKKAQQIKKKEAKENKIISKYIEPEPETDDDEPEIIVKKN